MILRFGSTRRARPSFRCILNRRITWAKRKSSQNWTRWRSSFVASSHFEVLTDLQHKKCAEGFLADRRLAQVTAEICLRQKLASLVLFTGCTLCANQLAKWRTFQKKMEIWMATKIGKEGSQRHQSTQKRTTRATAFDCFYPAHQERAGKAKYTKEAFPDALDRF